MEREQSLERDQVQLGLDWQRRCDDVERDQIQRSEALIQGLTKARDQVCWVVLGVEYIQYCTRWVWPLPYYFLTLKTLNLKYQLIYSSESPSCPAAQEEEAGESQVQG